MKKIGLLVMPFMAISLLASCGGNTPAPQVVEHFVTFESYGGDHIPTQRVKDGETATQPEKTPTRGDDTFLGWFTDFDKPAYTFKEKVNEDITLYAGWEAAPAPVESYTITFHGIDQKIENIEPGTIITNYPDVPPKEGHTPLGWCTDEAGKNVFDFSKVKIYQNYDLYPGYIPIITYTVTWVNEDGTVLQTDKVADGDMPPEYKEALPTKKSDIFNDYEFDNFLPKRSEVHSDQVYVAHYVTHTYPNTKAYISVNIKNDGETFELDSESEAYSDLTIDWGDGQKREGSSGYVKHTYDNAGEYNIRIFGKITDLDLMNNSAIKDVYLGDTITKISYGDFKQSSLQSITFSENSRISTIEDMAFCFCNNLVSVAIPSSVTSIGENSFANCRNLQSVIIPEDSKLATIGEFAFSDNPKLACVNIPSSVTSIGAACFIGCDVLQSIPIPEDSELTAIPSKAFHSCISLSSIYIPNSVTSIGDNAFTSCWKLSSITIPNSVTSIGAKVLYACSSLETIIVGDKNTVYTSQDKDEKPCNAIMTKDGTKLIAGCKNTIIPNSVTTISESAFASNSGLTSITIPNSVTSIGSDAFDWCRNFQTVDLLSYNTDSTIPTLGENVFYGCDNLTFQVASQQMAEKFINSGNGWPTDINKYNW